MFYGAIVQFVQTKYIDRIFSDDTRSVTVYNSFTPPNLILLHELPDHRFVTLGATSGKEM